jgi:hypothetical protein
VNAAAPWRSWHVDLHGHRNNRGISSRDARAAAFNIWGNSFPAEELPAPGSVLDVGDVSFRWPDGTDPGGDNVRCLGQVVRTPQVACERLFVLGAAERRTEDPIVFLRRDAPARSVRLALSDFWPQTPQRFGEHAAVRCTTMHYPRHADPRMGATIWRQEILVPGRGPLAAILLPDNPAMHLFALTLGERLR